MNLSAKIPANNRGFSLLELLIAALLLATAVAALFGTFVSAAKWIKQEREIGAYLDVARIESLREASRADWWSLSGYPLTIGGPYSEATIKLNDIEYTRTYTVSAVTATGSPDYRRVEVVTTWND